MKYPIFFLIFTIFSTLGEPLFSQEPSTGASETLLLAQEETVTLKDVLNEAATLKENFEYDKAIALLQALPSEARDIHVQKYLGRLYYLEGKSIPAYKTFKKIKEKDGECFIYLGLIFEDLGKPQIAIDNYLKSLELKKNSIAMYRLGKIYYRLQQYEEAVKFFSQAVEFDPSIRLANYYLGDCLFKIRDFKQAYSYAARGINFYPDNEKMRTQLLAVKSKLGEAFFTEVRRMIERTRRTVKLLFYKSAQDSPPVKVGLAKNLHKFSFRSGGDFTVTDGYREFTGIKDKFYTFIYKKKSILLMDYESGAVYKKFAPSVTMKTNGYPFYVLDVVYGKSNFWHKEIDRMYRGTLHVIAGNGTITLINILSMEEYLYGVVPSEIPSTSPPEALRAQAIAARTIALKSVGRHKKEGFDVCSQVHCQAYQGMSAEKPATNAAVDETRGEIVVDNEKEKPIEALYHANCGGCLRSDVFGKSNYLRNQLDSPKSIQKEGESVFLRAYGQERWMYDEPVAFCGYPKSSFRWQRVYDGEDFFLAFGFSLKNVKSIVPLKKGECGHYDSVKVITSGGENTLSGDLRIRDYFDKLRSSAFRVEVKFSANKEAQMLLFWGAGFGHAAGVCQEGAMGMASQGYTYDEILKHYYPNTKIKTAY